MKDLDGRLDVLSFYLKAQDMLIQYRDKGIKPQPIEGFISDWDYSMNGFDINKPNTDKQHRKLINKNITHFRRNIRDIKEKMDWDLVSQS